MRKLAPVLILVLLAVLLGPDLYHRVMDWRQADRARKRVEWMFRGKVAENEQLALCQWARGKVVMPMGDMEGLLPDWEAFWRESEFGDGRHWDVASRRVVDEITVEVIVAKGDERRTLHVRDARPLELVWED